MPDGVTLIIECRAQPGKGAVLRDELAALARTVAAREPDCLSIEMLQDDDDTRILRPAAFAAGPPALTFWRSLETVGLSR
jgi:hypothetical protein